MDFYHDAGQFYWGTTKTWNSKSLKKMIKAQSMN